MKRKDEQGPVYSTEGGKMCPRCRQQITKCCCSAKGNQAQGDGTVRVSRQTKGRKGSGVSIISGIPLQGKELKQLAKLLKSKCGSGGTVKNTSIEIQGDHRELLVEILQQQGYKAKIAGG